MRKISAREAYRIMREAGLDPDDDGMTFFAYDEDSEEIYEFDTKRERDEFVATANSKF